MRQQNMIKALSLLPSPSAGNVLGQLLLAASAAFMHKQHPNSFRWRARICENWWLPPKTDFEHIEIITETV